MEPVRSIVGIKRRRRDGDGCIIRARMRIGPCRVCVRRAGFLRNVERLGHRVNAWVGRLTCLQAFLSGCISFVKIPGQRSPAGIVFMDLRPRLTRASPPELLDRQKRESVKWRDSNLTGTYRPVGAHHRGSRGNREYASRPKHYDAPSVGHFHVFPCDELH